MDLGGRGRRGAPGGQELFAGAGLTHFEYFVLAMLSEAPERTLRITSLAQRTSAMLRLSQSYDDCWTVACRALPVPRGGRATNVRLTQAGWEAVVAAAPGDVDTARPDVLDPLTPVQVELLRGIGDALVLGSTRTGA